MNSKNNPPLPEKEVETVIKSILKKHEIEPQTSLATFNVTDIGNSERLITRHRDIIRYCYPWKKWIVWDEGKGIWQTDNNGRILRLAKETVKHIYKEAADTATEEHRKIIAGWGVKSESLKHLQAMVELSKSEEGVPVSPDELDTNQWLLNCLNGTIDLRTGELKNHDKNELITKITSCRIQSRGRLSYMD